MLRVVSKLGQAKCDSIQRSFYTMMRFDRWKKSVSVGQWWMDECTCTVKGGTKDCPKHVFQNRYSTWTCLWMWWSIIVFLETFSWYSLYPYWEVAWLLFLSASPNMFQLLLCQLSLNIRASWSFLDQAVNNWTYLGLYFIQILVPGRWCCLFSS